VSTSDRVFIGTAYVFALLTGVLAYFAPIEGQSGHEESLAKTIVIAVSASISGALLFCAFGGVISYAASLVSLKRDAHVAARVHLGLLVHPMTMGVLLALFAVCVSVSSWPAWAAWLQCATIYAVHTVIVARRIMSDAPGGSMSFGGAALSLVLGSELMTSAVGARSLTPRKLDTLPPDTWIVDVRTKAEFGWNRLRGAENFPWGQGLEEAAADKPRDTPVLVMCFSGHRSPSAAASLRRLGFQRVYNLSWGILYLILSGQGRGEGPLGLIRQDRRPDMRGKDYRGISIAYVTLIFASLIGAPIEHFLWDRTPGIVSITAGAILGIVGLTLGILSFQALGRNFRVFAAPRRSGTLVATGVYRLVRHPMYTGVVVGLLGYDLFWGSLFFLPAWAAVTILYVVKAVKEERLLMAKYPDYAEYKARSWMFAPYVY
jgi:protein-S-isoprenylcysteine O-methyltransferase Ste14/rhodanese-related sulfurtransferase